MELDYGRESNGQPKPEHPLSLIFPDMTAAEFSELVKSMRESGFDQAHDILTWRGEVVDGRHRQAAALEAGVQPRYQSLPAEWTLERVKAMLVKENLLHRNLDESQRAMVAVQLSEWKPPGNSTGANQHGAGRNRKNSSGSSNEEMSQAARVSTATVKDAKKVIREAPVLVEAVKNGVVTVSDAAAIASRPPEVQAAALELVLDTPGKTTLRKEAARVERVRVHEDLIAKAAETPKDERITLHHSAVADLHRLVKAESVDAIITDPPYGREYLDCYRDLADFAVHALKPGGGLYVMTGQMFLPSIMGRLEVEGLEYRWVSAFFLPHGGAQWDGRQKVSNAWKPVLMFTRSGALPSVYGVDVINAGGRNANDKKFHEWEQDLVGFGQLIDQFTLPGQLICDPLLGSGTTAIAARRLGRLFIGADIDPGCVDITKTRLSAEKLNEQTARHSGNLEIPRTVPFAYSVWNEEASHQRKRDTL